MLLVLSITKVMFLVYRYGIPVVREDERYSSVEAESYHDADDDEPIDDEAAAIILDQWLNKVPGDKNENH